VVPGSAAGLTNPGMYAHVLPSEFLLPKVLFIQDICYIRVRLAGESTVFVFTEDEANILGFITQ
jgi:hypothetical protein